MLKAKCVLWNIILTPPFRAGVLLTCACLLSIATQAQVNNVLNGSFEQYYACPTGIDQMAKAKYWHPIDSVTVYPTCAGEFCNLCADISSNASIPWNTCYYHYPRSGSGMAMIRTYFDHAFLDTNIDRDYTQGTFRSHLLSGGTYCVTFYVSQTQCSQYDINKIGAFIDDGSIDVGQDSAGCADVQTAFTPQIYTNDVIDDTLNWLKIQGNFTATGTEKFITLGNFFDVDHTDTVRRHSWYSNNYSFLLIDDVSVISSDAVADAGPSTLIGNGDTVHIGSWEDGLPCTWYIQGSSTPIGYGGGISVHPTATTTYVVELDLCGHTTYDTTTVYVVPASVPGTGTMRAQVAIYPIPATTQLHVDHAANSTATITDVSGRQYTTHTLPTNTETINIANLPTGTYLLTITNTLTGNRTVQKFQKE